MGSANVRLTDGRPAICIYDIDNEGFILLGLHNASGEILEISEAEYDNVEAQALRERKS